VGELRRARALGEGQQTDQSEKGRENRVHQAEHDQVDPFALDQIAQLIVACESELVAQICVDGRWIEGPFDGAKLRTCV